LTILFLCLFTRIESCEHGSQTHMELLRYVEYVPL
jgi:hypothetical protein